jgi:GDP/UDP-N,N'-diacetylbacillosamine 2-epimerase (hydrolysing)
MRVTLDALLHTGLRVFVSYPNSDSGSQQIIDIIEKYASQYPRVFHLYRNLPRTIFVNLLRRASVLVGNSSAGIIEAPLLRLPAVNVGPRQRGREHSENVIFVEPELEAIESAVHKAVFDKKFREIVSNCSNPYGDGHSGERIAGILAEHPIDDRLLNKINTF